MADSKAHGDKATSLLADDTASMATMETAVSEQLPPYTESPSHSRQQDLSFLVFGGASLKDYFSHDCQIRDEHTQENVYYCSGSRDFLHMVLRLQKGGKKDGKNVGQIKVRSMKLGVVMGDGWQTKLVRSHGFSNSFSFEAPDGSTFKWKARLSTFGAVKLIKQSKADSTRDARHEKDESDDDIGQVVAEWKEHPKFTNKTLHLTVRQQYAHLTDLFLITALGWEALAIEEGWRAAIVGGDRTGK
ncbi:hypothetical protein OIV83_004786 [Microbotryomycetes sp. JL201]|nr:hypothetical protein OIV83_004786 [Microbotryomycetes sp. JL201]